MEILRDKKFIIDVSIASTIAFVLSLLLSLLLATIIHYTTLGDGVIYVINIVLRCVAICLGSIIGIRHANKGLLKGAIIGITYIINTYLMFGMISSDFSITAIKVIDAICSLIFALISGIIAVNIKSRQ